MIVPYNQDVLYTELARAYYKVLTSIDHSDITVSNMLKEGLGKALSNGYIRAFKRLQKNEDFVV